MSSIWAMRRDTADGKVGGVCAGLARQTGIDPVLVRVGAVLLALSGGIGLVVYAAVWFFTSDEQGRTPVDEHFPAARRWPRAAVIAAVVVACAAVVGSLGSVLPFGIGPALVIAAIWYFGYYRHRRSEPQPPPAPTPGLPPSTASYPTFTGPVTPFTEAAAAWQRRVDEVHEHRRPDANPATAAGGNSAWPMHDPTLVSRVSEPVRDSEWPPRPAPNPHDAYLAQPDPVGLYVDPPAPAVLPPHRRIAARRLRLVSVAVLGLVLAGLAVADTAGAPIGLTTYLAAALLVGGLTLIAAAWLGRARGILPVTLLVALAGFVGVGATQAHLGDWGERERSYTSQTALPTADTLAGGSLSVDLSDLPVTRDQSYAATIDNGRLALTRPTASNVRIVWSVDHGLATLPGNETQTGRTLTGIIEPTGVQPGDPVLTVTLHVDRGALEVR